MLPFWWHEVSFAWWVCVKWHGVVILQFVWVVSSGNGLGGHFTASDSVNDFKLLVCEFDISHVKLVSDCSPPIFILWLLDELLDFINSLLFYNFLQLIIITEVLELIIPSIWHFTDLNFCFFVLFIIGLVVTNLYIFLLLLFFGGSLTL